MPWLLRLYNTALFPARAAAVVWAVWARLRPSLADELEERLARKDPGLRSGGVWIHGASVGEAKISSAVGRALRRSLPQLPLAMSAVTRAGRAQLPECGPGQASFFAPLDFPGLPGRLLDVLRPRAMAVVETELWPNLLSECAQRGIPSCLLNGRLAAERMKRYRRLRSLYRPLLAGLARIGAQTEHDAARFAELGAREEAIAVTGNIKYDLPPPAVNREALRRRFGLDERRRVVAAGSTALRENGAVLDAFRQARRSHPDLFLILAPRHPERASGLHDQAASRGLQLHRLSVRDDAAAGRADGILVDTLGELAGLWPLAEVAFVGGSLVPVGGHNVLEPASCGVPVVFGPHTHHIAEPADALERQGGAIRVADGLELGRAWTELLRDDRRRTEMGARAAGVVEAHRGALDRSARLLLELLEGGREAVGQAGSRS